MNTPIFKQCSKVITNMFSENIKCDSPELPLDLGNVSDGDVSERRSRWALSATENTILTFH